MADGAPPPSTCALVRQGSLIRTRSDIPLVTVTLRDPPMLLAALASGAQLISTDFRRSA